MDNNYDLIFEEAKKKKEFSINWITPYEDMLELLNKLHRDLVADRKIYNLDCICIIQLGCIDIEFTYYDVINNKIILDFFCCAEYENIGWLSHGFADMEFEYEKFLNKNLFEESMYKSLIAYAKKHNLNWSQLNKI